MRIEEVPLSQFDAMVDSGAIVDATTILGCARPTAPQRTALNGAVIQPRQQAPRSTRPGWPWRRAGRAPRWSHYRRDLVVWEGWAWEARH